MKHVVIVGGSFAGVSLAQRILKQAAKTATGPFKITLPAGHFEFALGSAIAIDVEAKQLHASTPGDGEMKLHYNFLILGNGSQTKGDTPFKSIGSTDSTKDALHIFQHRLKKAKTIFIVGASAIGVEIAGELAVEYIPGKKIFLIASGPTVLDKTPSSVSKTAVKALENLHVDIKTSTKVSNPVQLPDGRTEITLSTGEKVVADMCIPTYSVQPNSSYVAAKFLDANGFVKVDEYFAVKGAEGIFAIGDASNAEPLQF